MFRRRQRSRCSDEWDPIGSRVTQEDRADLNEGFLVLDPETGKSGGGPAPRSSNQWKTEAGRITTMVGKIREEPKQW